MRGVEPLCVADGRRAGAVAGVTGLVAAVLDVRMPGLHGVSAAVAVRALYPTVPLAIMTAFASVALPAELASARVFRKPFDLAAFSDWLVEVTAPRSLLRSRLIPE